MSKINIIGPGYLGYSKNVNSSRCINFYPELETPDSKDVSALLGTPGLKLFSNTSLNNHRGIHSFNGVMYFVAGDKLYSVNSGGTISSVLGGLATSTGRVVMTNNGLAPTGGNQLAITDGTSIYIYNVSTGAFTSNSITAHTICFLNGYFIADIGGGQWQVSGLYDGTSWSALDKSTADSSPDDLLAVFNNHNELWLFGEYTTEIWYNSGSGTPPFARMSSGVIDYGCAARYSIAKGNNTVFWLCNKRNEESGQLIGIAMASGYDADIISTGPINHTIAEYNTVNDAWGYCYTSDGNEFYVITFPSANATWAYDTTTRMWHERSSYVDDPYKVGRHRADTYAHYVGKHYVSDYQSGNIYEMSNSYYDENGEPIASIRVFPHLADKDNLNNTFIHKFQIDAETGVGESATRDVVNGITTITVGTNPQRVIDDGTHIWATNATTDNVSKINKKTNIVEATITVGNGPRALIAAGGSVWVLNNLANTVSRIDPDTNTVTATIIVGGTPNDIISDGTDLWIAVGATDSVVKIDMATNTIIATVVVGDFPLELLFDGISLWAANSSVNTVSKINISTNAVDATVTVGTAPISMAWHNESLWVLNYVTETVSKISTITDTVTSTVNVGNSPRSILYAKDSFFVTNESDDTVSRISEETAIVSATITVGAKPSYMIDDGKYLWVTNLDDGTISKVDVVNNIEDSTLTVGTNPERLIWTSDDEIWVCNSGATTVSRIQPYVVSDTTDPKAALSWSKDGGHTWSNEHFANLGKQGEYTKRLIWRRLGKSRDRVFRVMISSAVKKVLIAAHIQTTGGYH